MAAGQGAQAADAPRVVDLVAAFREGSYWASLRLERAFDQDILDTIASGLPVTFQYRVEVYQRRVLWTDLVHVRHLVKVTVDFDSLTRQYHLSREVDGQVVDSAATEKPGEMRRWMTDLTEVDLGALPENAGVGGRLWLRAKCRMMSRFVFFFFPHAVETRWARIPLPPPAAEESP